MLWLLFILKVSLFGARLKGIFSGESFAEHFNGLICKSAIISLVGQNSKSKCRNSIFSCMKLNLIAKCNTFWEFTVFSVIAIQAWLSTCILGFSVSTPISFASPRRNSSSLGAANNDLLLPQLLKWLPCLVDFLSSKLSCPISITETCELEFFGLPLRQFPTLCCL